MCKYPFASPGFSLFSFFLRAFIAIDEVKLVKKISQGKIFE